MCVCARVCVGSERKETHCEAQVVFMYSWNEMSEGGGLCPTMGMDAAATPVTAQLDEVAGALRSYVPPLT